MPKKTKRPGGYDRLFDPGLIKTIEAYANRNPLNKKSFAFALRELVLKGLDASKVTK